MIPSMGQNNIYNAIKLLEHQRRAIDSALSALKGVSDTPERKTRTLSRKARLAISRAQKKRWAKQRAGKK
jgi:hypothetical protein